VGSALPADGMRPVTRANCTLDSTGEPNARGLRAPGGMLARRKCAGVRKKVLLIDYDPQFNLSQAFIRGPKSTAVRDGDAVRPVPAD
jgi:hypothetical protein